MEILTGLGAGEACGDFNEDAGTGERCVPAPKNTRSLDFARDDTRTQGPLRLRSGRALDFARDDMK